MYNPYFRKTQKMVPVLSKSEINSISERYAKDFMPQILNDPQPFDIEGFIERYLQLPIDYQYLSNDGRYLGMTVFNDTNKVIIYSPEYRRAEYIHADQGTIIIDNTLLEKKQEHRYRFTLGHESGHWVFHGGYFEYNQEQMSFFEENMPYVQCREVNRNYLENATCNWNESRWMEWQADKFSAGILMPKSAVQILLEKEMRKGKFSLNDSYIKAIVSDVFNVSGQAAYFRLCDLGYIHPPQNAWDCRQLSFL